MAGFKINKNEKNRKKVVRKFINEHLEKYSRDEINNLQLTNHKNIFWKWNKESETHVIEKNNN